MRIFICVLLVAIMIATGAAFYFGLCTVSAECQDQHYVVNLAIHPDFMVPKRLDESSKDDISEYSLEAKGRIASVNPAKNEFVLTQSFKDLTFRVNNDTSLLINGQTAKLSDVRGGDEAAVTYTRQGQQLTANVVHCTRKLASQ